MGTLRPAWIWRDLSDQAPVNRFTWFRTAFDLTEAPHQWPVRFAANSNGRLWINGRLLLRKVPRYHEHRMTAQLLDAARYLKPGRNTIVVLHHSWGDITTFQRTGCRQAAIWLDAPDAVTDSSWRWREAEHCEAHAHQIIGLAGGAPRIRYPQRVFADRMIDGVHQPFYDDTAWPVVSALPEVPWPQDPSVAETRPQRTSVQPVMSVLCAGVATGSADSALPVHRLAEALRNARLQPDSYMTHRAEALCTRGSWVMEAAESRTVYVTFDMQRPVHGYPRIDLEVDGAPVHVALGYGEIARSLYTGKAHVTLDGWIDTEGVVGTGYADAVVAPSGRWMVEMPDERTARWLTLHLAIPADTRVTLHEVAVVKEQYAIQPEGSFACGDERMDQIVKLCHIHAEVTMSDTYVDTPGREDGQWIEDARSRAVLADRWYGCQELRRLMIRTLAEGQGPDGQLHPFAPSNFPAYPAGYDWSVQWTAMLWDDYMWNADTDYIRRWWPQLVAYWRHVLSLLDAEGLWSTAQVMADIRVSANWSAPTAVSAVVTPWMIERLEMAIQLADALGETCQAHQWRQTADLMRGAVRQRLLQPATEHRPAHLPDILDANMLPQGLGQAAQTWAINTGILTASEQQALADWAFTEPDGSPPPDMARWNNPTYFRRALHALCRAGRTERAVRHLMERMEPYLPAHPRNTTPLPLQGPFGGPLPEYWISREDLQLAPDQINPAQPVDDTGSHGWNAVPLLWLHEALLGVTIARPGGDLLRIAPRTGGLPYVCGTTCTPKGPVWIYWDPQAGRLQVDIPEGVQADLFAPCELHGPVRLHNGDRLILTGEPWRINGGQRLEVTAC